MKTKLYRYKGPVLIDGNCVTESWLVDTSAFDKDDAYNRLVMKYRHAGLDDVDPNAFVVLPGQLIEVKL